MVQQRLKAVFMRGGTSKGLFIHQGDLPANREEWDRIFLAAMGSPDKYVRQLDGMGGGISSLSKVCIVGPSTRPDADVNYMFAQISVVDEMVDYSGNCGNLSSAIGPFAVDEGLVTPPSDGEITIRIHNTNTGKIIASRFTVKDGEAEVDGDFELDGVSGTSAPIRLDFLNPGGAKTGHLLPTGNAVDVIDVPGWGPVEASLVDAGNPFVFVRAEAVGAKGTELPHEIGKNVALMQSLEAIRLRASVLMGIAPDLDTAAKTLVVPKVAMVGMSVAAPTLSGRIVQPSEADILSRTISVGQPHNVIPLTGALCLAVGARVPGTILYDVVHKSAPGGSTIRLSHPSGTTMIDAEVEEENGSLVARRATVFRSARRLFAGEVYYRG